MSYIYFYTNPDNEILNSNIFFKYIPILNTYNVLRFEFIKKGIKYYLTDHNTEYIINKLNPIVYFDENDKNFLDIFKNGTTNSIFTNKITKNEILEYYTSKKNYISEQQFLYSCEFPQFNILSIDQKQTKLMKNAKINIRRINYENNKRNYINSLKKSTKCPTNQQKTTKITSNEPCKICIAKTKKGKPCNNKVINNTNYCGIISHQRIHNPNYTKKSYKFKYKINSKIN